VPAEFGHRQFVRERETLNPYDENELRKPFEARRNSGVIEYVTRHVS